jgi:hypothetical protein
MNIGGSNALVTGADRDCWLPHRDGTVVPVGWFVL